MNLQEKYNLYLKLVKTQQKEAGFIYVDECDSLLFSGLVGCVSGIEVNVDAAHDPDTLQWLRRPRTLTPCYDCSQPWSFWSRLKEIVTTLNKESFVQGYWKKQAQDIFERGGSSISRDMFMGLAWYAFHNKRLDISEAVINYALSHWLIMGQGTPTRTWMTPGLLSTWAWISYRLGGPSRWWLRYLPQSESKSVTGFQAHLSVLHILLRNKLLGTNKYKDLLEFQYRRQPMNPLFAIAAGYLSEANMLLMNPQWWPENRFPSSRDRSSNWIIQRDYGSDWEPDLQSEEVVFSGGDFLFCAWLLLNE